MDKICGIFWNSHVIFFGLMAYFDEEWALNNLEMIHLGKDFGKEFSFLSIFIQIWIFLRAFSNFQIFVGQKSVFFFSFSKPLVSNFHILFPRLFEGKKLFFSFFKKYFHFLLFFRYSLYLLEMFSIKILFSCFCQIPSMDQLH